MKKTLSIATLWQLFYTFLTISPVTFGGGYTIIPSIEKAVVQRKRWCNQEDIVDIVAIAQALPGSVALNAAAFIGYRVAGVPGAVVASMGMILPTFCIVLLVTVFFLGFQHRSLIQSAMWGIQSAIAALILYAGARMLPTSVVDKSTMILMGGTVFALLFLNIHPIVILLCGGVCGGIIGWRKYRVQPVKNGENCTISQ